MPNEADARLDLIAFANGMRVDPETPGGDADLMAFLIGDLCDKRTLPVAECLTNRRVAVMRRYDEAAYDALAARHRLPHAGSS